jgi:hypothetical protein
MALDEAVTDRYQIAIPPGTILRPPSQTAARRVRESWLKGTPAMANRTGSTIDDLLADALIQKVMLADHVEPQALRSLLGAAQRRMTDARCGASAPLGQNLGRRRPFRALLMRPPPRAAAASLCG